MITINGLNTIKSPCLLVKSPLVKPPLVKSSLDIIQSPLSWGDFQEVEHLWDRHSHCGRHTARDSSGGASLGRKQYAAPLETDEAWLKAAVPPEMIGEP